MIKVEKITKDIIDDFNEDRRLDAVIYVSGNEAQGVFRMLAHRYDYYGVFSDEPMFNRSRLYVFYIWDFPYGRKEIEVMRACDAWHNEHPAEWVY